MKRLVTGFFIVCFWLVLVFLVPYWLFWAAFVLISLVCAAEFIAVLQPHLTGARKGLMLVCGILPVVVTVLGTLTAAAAGFFLAFFCVVLVHILWWDGSRATFDDLLRSLYLLVGVAFPLAHVVLIRNLDQGHLWALFAVAVVGAADTAAYYFGSRFGSRLLCPRVSPKKTWEGAVAGVVAGGAIAALFAFVLPPHGNIVLLAAVGALCAACGMLGDLAESMLKRSAGVKDSGTILAGHGGFLDRGDALFFSAPLVYYLLALGIL